MRSSKVIGFLTTISNRPAIILNRIAAWILALMMILTGIDVALRYIFNRPITGSYEIIEFMMPIVLAFGLANCALEKGHVRVELLTARLSERAHTIMDAISSLAFFCLFVLITWQSFIRALDMIRSGLKSEVLLFPVFPFVLAVTVGSGVLCLVVLRDFICDLYKGIMK